MSSSEHLHGYRWLDTATERPGAYVQVASCFYFFEGLTVQDVAEHARLRNLRTRGPVVDHELPVDFNTAVFDGGNGWTVVYQDNGHPEQDAHDLVRRPDAGRAVLVYWNVNARTEFSYWEDGERVVSFDHPDERAGSDPDGLLADMNETVVPLVDSSRTVGAYYAGMLALAQRITGIHLGPAFLNPPSMVVGFFDEDGDFDDSDDEADDPASLADNGRPSDSSFDAGGGALWSRAAPGPDQSSSRTPTHFHDGSRSVICAAVHSPSSSL